MTPIRQLIATHKQLLPLLILLAFSVSIMVAATSGTVELAGKTYDFELDIKHYFALAALVVSIIVYFNFRRYYKYVLAVTVFAGLFKLVNFSALVTAWGFRIGNLEMSFQASAFLAGLAAYFVNHKRVNSYLLDQIRPTPEEAKRKAREAWFEEVSKYKSMYMNHSTDDLNQILTGNKYVEAAKEGAKQLLKERQAATHES